ncbi:MAG TPA: cytochrome c3 family protein [Bacillota bacterium]|nr:cytochrome c3 family protein [Bacillota bacterium]
MYKKKLGNILVYGLTGMFVLTFVTMAISGIVSLVLFLTSPFAFAGDIDANMKANAKCLECHGKSDFSILRNGQKINLFVDINTYKGSIHGTNQCVSCHNDLGGIPHKNAVYGKTLNQQVNGRCQACHDTVARTYKKSVHGQLALADKATAYCTDCHGNHGIMRSENTGSMTYWQNIPATCTKCHNGNVKKAYNYSFHGISVRNGYDKSPTCVSCHGAHQILGPNDPKSMVSKANTPATCAQCHAKAAPGFANGKEHAVPQDRENAFPLWITWKVFLGLIVFDIFMSGSIILFELSRKWRAVGDTHDHHTTPTTGHDLKH